MPATLQDLRETNLHGRVRQWGVGGSACAALAQRGIRSVGIARLAPGYRIVRLAPAFSHLNVCLAGTGSYLVNGRWQAVAAGQALLFPRRHPHGAVWNGDRRWRMAWVTFADEAAALPLVGRRETELVATDPRGWEWALEGLHRETQGPNEPAHVQAWAEIVHQLVRRVVRPDERHARLAAVWERVEADPARGWTAAELAALAGVSEVHLRRLCLRALGRSPLQQVAWLRVRRAAFLLDSTPQTVEAAAWAVGYSSVSAFSAAFRRWLERAPRGGPATSRRLLK
jgi:AraC-like DNA-binding protein